MDTPPPRTAVQAGHQVVIHHMRPSCAIDDRPARLHPVQEAAIEHALCVAGERQQTHHDVSLRQCAPQGISAMEVWYLR